MELCEFVAHGLPLLGDGLKVFGVLSDEGDEVGTGAAEVLGGLLGALVGYVVGVDGGGACGVCAAELLEQVLDDDL